MRIAIVTIAGSINRIKGMGMLKDRGILKHIPPVIRNINRNFFFVLPYVATHKYEKNFRSFSEGSAQT